MANTKKNSSFDRAMKTLGTVETYYAKMICRASNKARLKIYRKLASLLRNRFSLMDALDLLHRAASNDGNE